MADSQRTKKKKNKRRSSQGQQASSVNRGLEATLTLASKTPSLTPADRGAAILTHLARGGSYRDIPYLLPMMRKKSQIAELLLTTDYISITVTNNTQYNTVQTVSFNSFLNVNDLKLVFDECRSKDGTVNYLPRYIYGGNANAAAIIGTGGAAIEYANNTAFGNSASLLSHDNHVLFTLFKITQQNNTTSQKGIANAHWQVRADGYPKFDWQDTSSITIDTFYWKPYFNAGDVTVNSTVGYLVCQMIWQFRGLK